MLFTFSTNADTHLPSSLAARVVFAGRWPASLMQVLHAPRAKANNSARGVLGFSADGESEASGAGRPALSPLLLAYRFPRGPSGRRLGRHPLLVPTVVRASLEVLSSQARQGLDLRGPLRGPRLKVHLLKHLSSPLGAS